MIALAVLISISGLFAIGGGSVHADDFQISLDQGSVITVDVSNASILWTNVLENGDMSKTTIPFSQIKQLVLSKAPASKQVAEIRKLLNQLGNDDYIARESAEEALSDPKIGGRFRSLIKVRAEDKNYEVRYRLNRVLERIDESAQEGSSEFDILTLTDGTVLEGDAGEFVIESNYRGNPSTFARSAIRLIGQPTAVAASINVNSKIKVNMFHDHETDFYQPDQVLIDFDYAPNGSELSRAASVNDVFIPFGVRMSTPDKEGYVGISGYPFKFSELVGANSVCVFEDVGTYSKRFKGITEFKFCMPNQPGVPAGVHEIGMFIARVNHSRDFLFEAYNADDELLASVESTDLPCVFSGVKTNEPITKVRILSNPYLFRVDRDIDVDYGIDSVCFSPPVPVANPMDLEAGSIRLRNGDLLKGDEIAFQADGFAIDLGEGDPIKLEIDEIQTIRFNTILEGQLTKTEKAEAAKDKQKQVSKKTKNYWMAVLNDRSTIRVEPGATFTSSTFDKLTFQPDEILGLKSSKNPTRLPSAKDFDKADRIIVFPTCRIASNNLKFTDKGFSWGAADLKLEQPVHVDDDEDAEDPTPKFTEIEYAKSGPDSTPTVWMNQPKSRAAGTGRMRMTDGQQLTLNGETGFKITNITAKSVSVSVGGNAVEIPLNKIHSIEFPAKN